MVSAKRCDEPKELKAIVQAAWYGLTGNTDAIVSTGNLPDVWAPNVKGRVNPAGSFDDLEGTIEYWYGLGGGAGNPDIVVSKVDLPYLVAEPNGKKNGKKHGKKNGKKNGKENGGVVMARADVTLARSMMPDLTLALVGFYRINSDCLIESYDVSALNLGKALDPPAVARTAFIQNMCGAVQQLCVNTNQVYDSFASCVDFMTNIEFGTYDRIETNSVVCRSVHLNMALFRPEIHCPHVSPGGGGKCIDVAYGTYFTKFF